MQDFFSAIRTHTTALENKFAVSTAFESPKAKLVYMTAMFCLVGFTVSLYLGTWLRH
jgi:hypothetical protein